MELIIKNFENLSEDLQQEIQDMIAGITPNFMLVDLDEIKSNQKRAVAEWRKRFEERQGIDPSHIDLDKVLELIETGEIQDQGLVVDPRQKTLEAFR